MMLKILKRVYYLPLLPRFIYLLNKFFKIKLNFEREIKHQFIKNILIVKLDEIGDFVLCTPFLRELRRNYPDSKITLIVKEEVFNLAENCPYVDMAVPLNLKMNKIFRVFIQYYRVLKICKNYLWKENFDLAIIPRWDRDDNYHAFTAYFSKAKNIIGYNQKDGTEKLLDLKFEKDKIQHEVLQNLDIIKFIGGKIENNKTELWITKDDDNFAFKILESVYKNICIIIAPGASKKKRQWPIENYALLIKMLTEQYGNKISTILVGAKSELNLAEYIISNTGEKNIINLIGKTSLRQVASIIKKSDMFIGNDSGLMHIAAVFEIPIIAIFCHPKLGNNSFHNSPYRFGPWTDKKIVLQPKKALYPCIDSCISKDAHCIKQIKVEDVFKAVKSFIYKDVKK